jgi:Uma2 family endonuclease
MTAATKRLTLSEYLDIERRSDEKHEYFAGEVFAMAGASPNHNVLVHNVGRALGNALDDTPCRVFSSDQRVKTKSTLYTYPDVTVVCAEPEYEQTEPATLLNPLLIVEVLSPSTAVKDLGFKFEHYRSIPSLKTYVLVDQDRMFVQVYERHESGGWLFRSYDQSQEVIRLTSIKKEILLGDLYRKVDLPQ